MAESRTNPPSALIVCVSEHHGNTHKVARALAEVMHAEVIEPEDVDVAEFHRYDLVGFGSGIYFGTAHQRLAQLIDRLPHGAGRSAFTFSTSGMFLVPWMGMSNVRDRLRDKGYNLLGDFNCRGFDTVGPLRFLGGLNRGRPDEADLTRARRFGRDAQAQAAAHESSRTVSFNSDGPDFGLIGEGGQHG